VLAPNRSCSTRLQRITENLLKENGDYEKVQGRPRYEMAPP